MWRDVAQPHPSQIRPSSYWSSCCTFKRDTHTSRSHPPPLILSGSFSIICLSDSRCGRIRADTSVPAATRGYNQHSNIFSLCYLYPSLPCVHAALQQLTRSTEKMINKGRKIMKKGKTPSSFLLLFPLSFPLLFSLLPPSSSKPR